MPANVCERTTCCAAGTKVGWHWPPLAGVGAGDGNRKYRPGANNNLISTSYELDQALRVIFV
jgi:hypothetical protein